MSRALCLLVTLAGCAVETSPDAPARDAGPADASLRPVGAACADDAHCAGACLRDLRDPAMGRRCFPPCDDGQCPVGEACVAGARGAGCVAADAPLAMSGEACGERRCASGLACTADHPAGVVCAPRCAADADCPPETRCPVPTVEPRVCLPPASAAFSCAVLGCARPDLRCVELAAGFVCVEPCGDIGEPCPGGGRCERAGQGGGVCEPTGGQGLGSSCASGGGAACEPGLGCLGAGPGDPEAICSRPCADAAECCPGCDEVYICRALTGPPICIAAPFGAGDESGPPGADCAPHGLSDCLPGLACVTGVAEQRVCAAPCADGCPDGFCAARPEGAFCWPGAPGAAGAPCPTGTECVADATCIEGPPEVRYCAASCAAGEACPAGSGCRDGVCRIGVEARALGADCGAGGAAVCASGVCVVDPADGAARCSQSCAEGPCPADFACVDLDGLPFCLPGAD